MLHGSHPEKNNIRSWVISKELSRGWVISGKCLPNENSVMTCERFMTVKRDKAYRTREMVIRTVVVDMKVTTVTMADGSNMKVC